MQLQLLEGMTQWRGSIVKSTSITFLVKAGVLWHPRSKGLTLLVCFCLTGNSNVFLSFLHFLCLSSWAYVLCYIFMFLSSFCYLSTIILLLSLPSIFMYFLFSSLASSIFISIPVPSLLNSNLFPLLTQLFFVYRTFTNILLIFSQDFMVTQLSITLAVNPCLCLVDISSKYMRLNHLQTCIPCIFQAESGNYFKQCQLIRYFVFDTAIFKNVAFSCVSFYYKIYC